MALSYPAIATNSNYHAIALEVVRNGVAMPALGSVVTVTVKDRDTHEVIVPEDTVVGPKPGIEGRWEYFFSPEQVALITKHAVWLVEWKLVYGQYTWRSPEPVLLPVRKKI